MYAYVRMYVCMYVCMPVGGPRLIAKDCMCVRVHMCMCLYACILCIHVCMPVAGLRSTLQACMCIYP
jgi:hypothetical protein